SISSTNVQLGADVVITTDGTSSDGAITITGTVNGGQSLNLTADTGAVSISGAVGGLTPLSSFTVTSARTVALPAVTTSPGGISLPADTNITLNGDLDGASSIGLSGNVTLGTPAMITLTHSGSGSLSISGGTLATNGKTLIDNAATAGTTGTTGTISSPVT